MRATYKTLNFFLLSAIPQFRDRYGEEKLKRGEHPPQYVAFAALNAMVMAALDFGGDPGFLSDVFNAFERMALSNDPEVVTVLRVGFVENVVRYPKRLAEAWEQMGAKTRKLTVDTARAWNREANLPAPAREKSKAQAAG